VALYNSFNDCLSDINKLHFLRKHLKINGQAFNDPKICLIRELRREIWREFGIRCIRVQERNLRGN
jgi:hypothetical protein